MVLTNTTGTVLHRTDIAGADNNVVSSKTCLHFKRLGRNFRGAARVCGRTPADIRASQSEVPPGDNASRGDTRLCLTIQLPGRSTADQGSQFLRYDGS